VTVWAVIEDFSPHPPRALEPSGVAVWQQLIRDQHGLLDTDQLRLLDIGPGVVTANLEAQRWLRVLPRVYATFTGPRAFPHLKVATDPARTSKADTVLDLATSEPNARAGMRRFVALATRGRVPVRELQRRLEERRPRRYGAALADALRLLADGVQSVLEQRYACEVEMAHALPIAKQCRGVSGGEGLSRIYGGVSSA
jgi:hypothetical protein